jgi:hypothetical protein
MPNWTTGTRPASPRTGQQGFNTTLNTMEFYNGSAWATGGGFTTQSVQTTGFTAVAGNLYPCNTTSAAFTVTLPLSPIVGNQIQLIDYAGTFATNNLTLGRNGSNITGVAENFLLRANRQSTILTYIDATQGWVASTSAYTITPLIATTYAASILTVGGGAGATGGASGVNYGSGSAGGILRSSSTSLTIGTTYTATVGAGGTGVSTGTPASGGTSSFTGATSATGGIGLINTNVNGGSNADFAGGTGSFTTYASGGGAGSGAVGGNSTGTNTTNGAGGAGGAGATSSITGTSTNYGGGGGGTGATGPGGNGGAGGGGGGSTGGAGTAGTANTGGGAGGGSAGTFASGGSGVVILSVPTSSYSGTTTGSPTITTSGSNTIIKFTASGSYTA